MIYRQCEFGGDGRREANMCKHGTYWAYYPRCEYYRPSPHSWGGICYKEPTVTDGVTVIRVGSGR